MRWCAALFLAGCAVGPDYERPSVPLPPAWKSPLEGGVAAQPVDLAGWWKKLKDPLLDSLVARSVESNLDLQFAKSRIREARARRDATTAGFWPFADASASYSRSYRGGLTTPTGIAPTPFGIGEFDLYEAGFDAAWEIDLFGGVRRAVEAAEADIEVAAEFRRDVWVSLLAEVASAYVQLRGAQKRLDIAQDTVRLQREALSVVDARFQVGLTNELDVAQAQSQLATFEAAIPVLEILIRRFIYRLDVLLGREQDTLAGELLKTGPLPAAPVQVPVGVPSELLRRRPDIRRAERELAAATARIGVATADLYPRLSLTGSWARQSQNGEDLTLAAATFWTVGPAIRWAIFRGGRIRANIRFETALQEQALARYRQTILLAFEETENALVSLTREEERRRALARSVEAAARSVKLASDLYARGLTSFLNVLDSQRTLNTARDDLSQSETRVILSWIALYKALGGGWD